MMSQHSNCSATAMEAILVQRLCRFHDKRMHGCKTVTVILCPVHSVSPIATHQNEIQVGSS
jgi:hypothetical protein